MYRVFFLEKARNQIKDFDNSPFPRGLPISYLEYQKNLNFGKAEGSEILCKN